MHRIRILLKKIIRNEEGIGLLEIVLTILILGIIGAGLVMTASTASRTLLTTDRMDSARNYAQYLMEYIKKLDYQEGLSSYTLPSTPGVYQGFTASNTIAKIADGKQKVTVTIQYGGKTIYTLEGYKIK